MSGHARDRLPLGLFRFPGSAPCPWAWLAAPWMWGGGGTRGAGARGAGQGAVVWVRGDGRAPRAGCQERGQEKVEVHLRLLPGRIREPGAATPMMVTTPP